MAPRKTDTASSRTQASPKRSGPGQDRKRALDDKKHHPAAATPSRKVHKPQKKPALPPRHTPHAHPHGDATGPHANKPSPIKPAKKITRTGSKSP